MKIVFATSSFQGGGITSYALEFIHNYSIDNEFYVIVGDDSKAPIKNLGFKIIHCEALDTSMKNAQYIIHEINQVIKPDVLINSNSKIISLVTPFLLDSIRIITVSHSLKYVETDVAAVAHKYVDAIVALSSYNKKYIDRRFNIKNPDKTKVVYNFVTSGVDVDNILYKKKNAKKLNILYMGGTAGAKSPELVFSVLKKLLRTNRYFHFYWLGANTPTLQKLQPFKSIADVLPNDERLTFTGRIPRKEAETISQNANIILIPSKREGCPMALLEAMRYGVISVTSDYKNACREIIQEGYNGFVIPHRNIDEFVDTICKIIDNHDEYKVFYDNSISTFNSKLSFPVWKTKMDEIVFSKQRDHCKRKNKYSKFSYCLFKSKFNIMNYPNAFHKFFYETLPSALTFFIEYFKCK